jgi:hypothetical protein
MGKRLAALTLPFLGAIVPDPASGAATTAASQTPSGSQQEIVITAPPLFRDVQPEQSLDEGAIASYGVSTTDELLSEVQGEAGDDEPPVIMVNGQKIDDPDQISGLPVEALHSVQVFPRGSAVRVGGTSGQRVISVTLARHVRSATLLVAPKIATDGNWRAGRGEAILTDVKGSTRFNLAFRARGESSLLESERDIVQPDPRLPYAQSGNVIAYPDLLGEIDPVLSAGAGQIVTVAPVPAASNPTLADFLAGANQPALTDLGQFRTLRPRIRYYDLNGNFSTKLTPWLTSTASLRLSRNLSRSLRGLPNGLFVLSDTNPASPFSTDVGLVYYGQDPLHTRIQRDGGEGILTLNAQVGSWALILTARHAEGKDTTRTERQGVFGSILIDDSVNPFATDLSDTIGVISDRATSRTTLSLAQLSATGPTLKLPAGDVTATIEGRLAWNRLKSKSSFGGPFSNTSFRRNEQAIRGAIDIPLTSRDNKFLPEIGDLNASAEYSRVHFSDAGNIDHYTLGLTWDPTERLRFHADLDKTERPPAMQTLGYPVIVTTGVRVFDALTGDTVDVVQITGGNPTLLPETTKLWRVSGLARLVPRLNLQLNAEYTDIDIRHFVSALPEASAAVMEAFPGRFVRDINGVLTTVDLRPVNFDSHREKRLRYGLSLNTALGGHAAPARVSASSEAGEEAAEPAPAPTPSRGRRPPTRLQLSVNHTIVFSDEIRIRPGLDTVDLLEGGAIGIGGGRVRHQLDGTASLTSGGLGARIGVAWRGPSTLDSEIAGVSDTLHFSPLVLVNLKAFADLRRFLPHSPWAKNTRISLTVTNLTNDRQRVRDPFGDTPLQYQPGYRDPLGRTIELEIRKVF